MRTALLLSLLTVLACGPGAAATITEKNVAFLNYPDFPDAHSSWGSIGYSSVHKKVVIGVCNHRDRLGLYEYDVRTKKLSLRGFVDELANLRDFQWQGKIHSKIAEDPDGAMYFSTDGGESREEYLMEHPHGYSGGLFFRWDSAAGRLTNAGMAMRHDSIKDVDVDRVGGLLFGVSYPQVHFFVYDTVRNDLRDLGRLGSPHVPRTLVTDWWGNCYYVDWRQRLVKYERATGKLIFSRESLPAFPGTPGGRIITGLRGFAKDQAAGVIYLITFGSKVLAFHPEQSGIGRVDDLGGLYDDPSRPPYNYQSPNLALSKNGNLYYFLGGHGMYAEGKPLTVLMEFDPRQRSKRAVLRFPLEVVNEATGSDVRDDEGNLYFAARRNDAAAAQVEESGASRPVLIIFNPEKELR